MYSLGLFDRRSSLYLLFFLLPLLFLPKINLLSFEEETAGLRLDDIFLFVFASLVLLSQLHSRRDFLPTEKRIFLFTACALGSFALNGLFYSLKILPFQAHIFYSLRLLEYFLFVYIGYAAQPFISCRRLFWLFFLWNGFFILLQKGELIGAFTIEGYTKDFDRACGLGSFPNEIGGAFSLLFAYFLFSKEHSFLSLFGMTALFLTFTALTGSRIALIAIGVLFLLSFLKKIWNRPLSLLFLSPLLLPLLAFLAFFLVKTSAVLYERSQGLFSYENLHVISRIFQDIDPNSLVTDFVKTSSTDESWIARLYKWCQATKLYYLHPECYLFGLGPGSCGAALDGGLLRLLVENGIIGLASFFFFLRSLMKESRPLTYMVLALLINMIFIDAHLAYKPMSLLFLAFGATQAEKERELSLAR